LLFLVFFLLLLLLSFGLLGGFLLFFLLRTLFVLFATFDWNWLLCFLLCISGFSFLLSDLLFGSLRVGLSASKSVVCADFLLLSFFALCRIHLFLEPHEQHLQVLFWDSIADELNCKFGIGPVLTLQAVEDGSSVAIFLS
jgi:cell division protein FtsW (lipid II flippase)